MVNQFTRISGLTLIITFLISMVSITHIHAFPEQSEDFTFTLTDGSTISLKQYNDKPIFLEWTASWCPVCKANDKVINDLYQEYKDLVNFISISYGGSGDDLQDVKDIKASGPYSWTFGLDTDYYSSVAGTQNADIWILNSSLSLKYTWRHVVIEKSDVSNKLNEVLVNDFQNKSSSLTLPSENKEVQTLGVFTNPLFLGFIAFAVLGTVFIALKKKPQ